MTEKKETKGNKTTKEMKLDLRMMVDHHKGALCVETNKNTKERHVRYLGKSICSIQGVGSIVEENSSGPNDWMRVIHHSLVRSVYKTDFCGADMVQGSHDSVLAFSEVLDKLDLTILEPREYPLYSENLMIRKKGGGVVSPLGCLDMLCWSEEESCHVIVDVKTTKGARTPYNMFTFICKEKYAIIMHTYAAILSHMSLNAGVEGFTVGYCILIGFDVNNGTIEAFRFDISHQKFTSLTDDSDYIKEVRKKRYPMDLFSKTKVSDEERAFFDIWGKGNI